MSEVTLKAFVALTHRWELSAQEAAALLGVSESMWDRIKNGMWDGPLSQDQLMRASATIGIYKGLHTLFIDGMADRWPRLTNQAAIFQGRTLVVAMEGGIPTMLEIRQYVDVLGDGF